MLIGLLLWFAVPQAPNASPSRCGRALAAGIAEGAADICQAESEIRLGDAAPKGSEERTRHWQGAVVLYRRAADAGSSGIALKAQALNALADLYDAQHLNDLARTEEVLREVVALQPQEVAPLFRLAKVEEGRGLLEAAEATLLTARHQEPDAPEPCQALAQFYARRVTALRQATQTASVAPTPDPGERDENGVYLVGGAVTPPQRLDRAVYPPEAMAAGIQGSVIVEVVVSETGEVTTAKVVRSVPLLDDEAVRSVQNWHFAPALVNGQAVPVKMNVTVNFSTR